MGNISDQMLKDHRDMFFSDWQASVSYHTKSRSTNYNTGAVTTTDTSETLECVTRPVSGKSVRGSAGRYKVGDRSFEFRTEDLPEDPPKQGSAIRYKGVDYSIIDFERSCQNHVTIIMARNNKET